MPHVQVVQVQLVLLQLAWAFSADFIWFFMASMVYVVRRDKSPRTQGLGRYINFGKVYISRPHGRAACARSPSP